MTTSRRFGDRATFAVEVAEVAADGSGGLREVDLWAAGRLLTAVDNLAYVPFLIRVLRDAAAQVRLGAVPSSPNPGTSPEVTFRRLEADETAFQKGFWFDWGEILHNVRSFRYLEDGDLVLLFAFHADAHPHPDELGRVFHVRLDPAEFAATLEAAADLLDAGFSRTLSAEQLLLLRLRDAGMSDVTSVSPAEGGLAAVAGFAHRAGAPDVFVKTFAQTPGEDVFGAEAEGLAALREAGATTPHVLLTGSHLLVLEGLRPRVDTTDAWERLAHVMARVHTGTAGGRFGWHRDTWLGRMRQDNTWEDDGHVFFARRRLLRWLPEPRVREALDAEDRRALERLCDALPELLPAAPACLTHGDFWSQNVLATAQGEPALIDPAVSRTWAEVDLSMLWSSPRPPESDRFFDVYAELTGLDAGWRERMPLLHLRQHLAVVAQFEPDWGHAEQARAVLKPFRRR